MQQGEEPKVCRKTYERRCWLGIPYDHHPLVLGPARVHYIRRQGSGGTCDEMAIRHVELVMCISAWARQ